MASRVITGEAKAVVIRTGDRTFWGHLCAYKRKDSIIWVVSLEHRTIISKQRLLKKESH